jgi:very-short-patch-repair endonuclease
MLHVFRLRLSAVPHLSINAQLAAHLATSDGLITTDRALVLGVSARQLEGLVKRGELERMHRGVYRSSATAVTQRHRLLAGLAAAGDSAVISHRSALASHGAPNFKCSLVELTNRSKSLPIREGLIVHRSSTLGAADLERVDRMWVTTKERTAIDACTLLPPTLVMRYVEHWLANRKLKLEHLHDTLGRLRAVPGAQSLARALDTRDLGRVVADSIAEDRLGALLIRSDLAAVHHVLVTTATGYTYELDWAYPDANVALEMDGYGIHMRSVGAFDDDRFRRNELEVEGWQVLNFTERQLRRQPGRVVQQIRGALARREDHLHGA